MTSEKFKFIYVRNKLYSGKNFQKNIFNFGCVLRIHGNVKLLYGNILKVLQYRFGEMLTRLALLLVASACMRVGLAVRR
jgi:hypothetical protein